MCHEKWKPAGERAVEGRQVSFAVSAGQAMPGWRYGHHPSQGVCLVLPDIYGPSPFYHRLAALLADEGYETVLVDYFFRQGPIAELTRDAAFARRAPMDENLCLQDIGDVIDQLAAERPAARVGIVGFCLSGSFALDLSSLRGDLATVAYYAFPEGPGGPVAVAAPKPIEIADRFRGPITAFWGDQDYIPLPLIERFGAEMARHDVDYEEHLYAGVGHGFLQGLVEDRHDSAAAHDAWTRTLTFLSKHLARTAAP